MKLRNRSNEQGLSGIALPGGVAFAAMLLYRSKKPILYAAIGVLAFAIAGCGGGTRHHRGGPAAAAAIPTATAAPATVKPSA
ncbi:MAG: hypothetical protein WBG27_12410, partial [Candidatus Aquilonibacter sp.]